MKKSETLEKVKPIGIEIKQRELTTQLKLRAHYRLFYLLIKITDSLILCIYHRIKFGRSMKAYVDYRLNEIIVQTFSFVWSAHKVL